VNHDTHVSVIDSEPERRGGHHDVSFRVPPSLDHGGSVGVWCVACDDVNAAIALIGQALPPFVGACSFGQV
jgi:hypothetical protein